MKKFIATSLNEYTTLIIEEKINKVLYHGSYNEDLTTLNPYTNRAGTIPPSIFLTSKKSVANDYGDIIYKCKLNCNEIKEIDVHGISFHDYLSFEHEITKAYNDGYDCIVFKNIMDSKEPNTKTKISDVYVVFNSNNVTILNKV